MGWQFQKFEDDASGVVNWLQKYLKPIIATKDKLELKELEKVHHGVFYCHSPEQSISGKSTFKIASTWNIARFLLLHLDAPAQP